SRQFMFPQLPANLSDLLSNFGVIRVLVGLLVEFGQPQRKGTGSLHSPQLLLEVALLFQPLINLRQLIPRGVIVRLDRDGLAQRRQARWAAPAPRRAPRLQQGPPPLVRVGVECLTQCAQRIGGAAQIQQAFRAQSVGRRRFIRRRQRRQCILVVSLAYLGASQ